MTRPTFPETPLHQRSPISPLRARDEALSRVESTSAPWRSFADRAVAAVARRLETLTSDDVWDELERMGIPRPSEGRAMGVVMRKAVKDGLLRPEGFTTGRNPRHHLDVARLYRSTVAR